MHRSLRAAALTLLLILVPCGVAAAATDAETRFPVDSPAMQVAQSIAVAHWGVNPCGGAIDLSWVDDDATINARSFWSNPVDSYAAPDQNTDCRIAFNRDMTFSWPKLCTVVVHEYGHLSGHDHTVDGPDVMSPIYRAPLAECAATPDPTAAPVAPVAPVSAPAKTAAAPRTRTGSARRATRRDRASRASAGSRA